VDWDQTAVSRIIGTTIHTIARHIPVNAGNSMCGVRVLFRFYFASGGKSSEADCGFESRIIYRLIEQSECRRWRCAMCVALQGDIAEPVSPPGGPGFSHYFPYSPSCSHATSMARPICALASGGEQAVNLLPAAA
jgi:hypothetical protein